MGRRHSPHPGRGHAHSAPARALVYSRHPRRFTRIYIWAQPLDKITDKHLRDHLVQTSPKRYLTTTGFIYPRHLLLRHLEPALLPALEMVEGRRPARRPRQHRPLQSRRRPRPHPLRIHRLLRRHRLGHVARSQLDLHHLRPGHPHRPSALRHVFRGGRRAHPLQLQAHVGDVDPRLRPRPRQVDARLHHGLGLLQLSRSGSSSGPATCPPKSPITSAASTAAGDTSACSS